MSKAEKLESGSVMEPDAVSKCRAKDGWCRPAAQFLPSASEIEKHVSTMVSNTSGSRRAARAGIASAALLALAGCNRSPSISILGSFFPAWMLCLLIGIVLTFAVHSITSRSRFAGQLGPGLLVYPSLAGIFTMTLWLLFYS